MMATLAKGNKEQRQSHVLNIVKSKQKLLYSSLRHFEHTFINQNSYKLSTSYLLCQF